MESRLNPGSRPGGLLTVTENDRRVLAFAAAHRFVTATQVETFLKLERGSVDVLLAGLTRNGLLRGERLLRSGPLLFRVTPSGLAAIGSRLPAPGFDLAGLRHEIGVVWLWMAAWRGAFGPLTRVLSAREMEAADQLALSRGEPGTGFAIPVANGGRRAGGCYPDLGLVTESLRLGVRYLPGHGLPGDIDEFLVAAVGSGGPVLDRVMMLVESRAVGDRILALADRLGVRDRVGVQLAGF